MVRGMEDVFARIAAVMSAMTEHAHGHDGSCTEIRPAPLCKDPRHEDRDVECRPRRPV